ncbi:ROK family transcriptional regulator [Salinibacterium sp. NSLL150]|uniref:ROK family transcriptional regulator n=1 Tax=unclassified Salinibacterium TaxID=2632331 RepID=UPI0018CD0773|nr:MULTISPECIES: ROK family transcriptional regulator [unclassified Salinibacterium]MBH0098414.1 ROK family transcriptional regulator [Salinibacterium sp. NSLL35]MBH0101169.1 ROK family transcriptional regulator [Salinibacterium sp. NSLL150]MBH0103928.1 ROK family transcriptional regulator [Salinibacterium sp. NSLL16]MBH0106689.1 ROK family transcriptional regulator [Salinibacterium sp. NSLL17]
MSNEAVSRFDEATSVRAQVLTMLRDSGPLPRIELARRAHLSPTTITRAVSQLVDEGVIVEGNSISPTKLGRPATEISIVRDAFVVVGVQVGVGFVQLGLIDLLGGTVASSSLSYDIETPATEVMVEAATAINELIAASEYDQSMVIGVGVAVPGPVDVAGRSILLPINLDWRDVPVADILEPLTGLPVTVEHNVRSMALAEARFGVAKDLGSVAFIYLRTGLGAGLVVEGQPFAGGVRGAIELGHLHVIDNGIDCVCGGNGCLETIVSEGALQRQLAEAGLSSNGGGALTALYAAADTNETARASIDSIITQLATATSAIVNLLNPDVILLGGALAEVPEAFFERLTEQTRQQVFPLIRPLVRIEPSSLGMYAGVLGGGTAALERYFYI